MRSPWIATLGVGLATRSLAITAGLLAGVLVLARCPSAPARRAVAGHALQLLGLACIACAALGRIWASVFIAGFKDTRLVREGPYSVLRHPLYALSMVAMLGVGLATRSVAITAVLVAAFGVIYLAAARAEDDLLHALHGAEFERFRAQRRAFVPRWSAYRVPETLEIRPRVLWKAFLDAGSLLGYYALLRLADALQLAGTTPTWLALP